MPPPCTIHAAPLWLQLLNGKDKPLAKIACLKQPPLHDTAAEALVNMGKGAVPDLIAVLKNEDSKRTERIDAATILGDIGSAAVAAKDQLQLAADNDQYPTVKATARAALVKIRRKR